MLDADIDLVAAVRSGNADGLLPPVVVLDRPGELRVARLLSGAADAAAVAELLRQPQFSPLPEMLAELGEWCGKTAAEFADVVSGEVLEPLNGELFGPLIKETFVACLGGPRTVAQFDPGRQSAGYQQFLTTFLRRLRADSPAGLPVTGLTAHDAETHNGRQRVLRVDLGGRRLAYKPRPADGEQLFLASSGSVFALLNQLPPVSGNVRLPVIDVRPGDGSYSWQEWVERPAQWGPIRRSDEAELHGTRLAPAEAGRFWHRAGSLAAACFGFGITDLGEGNVVTGTRPGETEPLYYPIDLEVFSGPVRRLHETGLIAGAGSPHHHPAMESEPRWCSAEGTAACLVEPVPGELRLWRRRRAWARGETRTVVADTLGRTGYATYLTAFARGMFDAWTLLCTNREQLRDFLDRESITRVLLRPTSAYTEALDDLLLSGRPLSPDYEPTELEQLERLDVPYYFRSTAGGPLLRWDPATGRSIATTLDVAMEPALADWAEGLTLARLGIALRDAIEYVAGELAGRAFVDDERGVRITVTDAGTGEASFDWPGTDRRITYRWHGSKVSLRVRSLSEIGSIRRRLLRLDSVDAGLRDRWIRSGFDDRTVERQLRDLTGKAADWLRAVIADHGWPGSALVGDDASAVACRLVQHLEDRVEFQRECLALVRRAAAAGDVPWRQVAYLTDATLLQEGEPQLYGTKFKRENGELVPCPITDPAGVDRRRQELGLEPLEQYADRLRERFSAAAS